jgi:hypothetical protein
MEENGSRHCFYFKTSVKIGVDDLTRKRAHVRSEHVRQYVISESNKSFNVSWRLVAGLKRKCGPRRAFVRHGCGWRGFEKQ